jgi:hypothetical protein
METGGEWSSPTSMLFNKVATSPARVAMSPRGHGPQPSISPVKNTNYLAWQNCLKLSVGYGIDHMVSNPFRDQSEVYISNIPPNGWTKVRQGRDP